MELFFPPSSASEAVPLAANVLMKLSVFWPDAAEVWFAQADAQFAIRNVIVSNCSSLFTDFLTLVFELLGDCCPPDLFGLASQRISASGQGPASSASRVRSSPTVSLQFPVLGSPEEVFLTCIWIWWDSCLQARYIVIF